MNQGKTESAFGSRFREKSVIDLGLEQLDWGLPQQLLPNRLTDIASILPKNVAELLDETAEDTGATQELVFSLILGTSAIAVQGLYDVQHFGANLKLIPASLFVVCVAGSTQRKSTVLEILLAKIEDYQQSLGKNDILIKVKDAQYRGWQKKCDKIFSQIEENFDNQEKTAELQTKLEALETIKPDRGKSGINLINRDTTLQALLQGTETQSPSTSSVLHEARNMLSRLKSWMAALNELWDGVPIQRARIATGLVLQFNPRFSFIWIIQPNRWRQYLNEDGVDFLESGLGGRVLVVACPDRKPTGEIRRHSIARNARDRHDALIKRLVDEFDEKLKKGNVNDREKLKLSAAADELFMKTRSWIEINQGSRGYFSNIPEFGGRCAENIMRIAAILHVIEGCEGAEISEDILISAILVMRFMTEQHKKMFGDLRKPVGEVYARKVEQYLLRCFNLNMVQRIPVRKIQQFVGSQEIRSRREHVTAALEVLAKQGSVKLYLGTNSIESVSLNWDHFNRLSHSATFLSSGYAQ